MVFSGNGTMERRGGSICTGPGKKLGIWGYRADLPIASVNFGMVLVQACNWI